MTSTVRPSFDVVRVTKYENWCERCSRVTTQYEWSDGKTDCQACLTPEPRALPMLPLEDGLGFGLHATTPPARWRIDWVRVLFLGLYLLGAGAVTYTLYSVGRMVIGWIAG